MTNESEITPEAMPQEVALQGMSSTHARTATTFIEQLLEYAAKGYVLHPKPVSLRQVPSFVGRPRCTMVTKERATEILGGKVKKEDTPVVATKVEEAKAPTESVVSDVDVINTLTKKDELLSHAELKGIEVPQETIKKGVKSIKQFLITSLSE